MPRLSPSWRHTCLLIAGTLVITGCGSEGASSDANLARSQSHSLDHGSDLVITELRAPDSVRDGSPFTATVTVCNQGSAGAYPQGGVGGTLVQVYLSTTATQQVPGPNPPPTTQQITVGEVDVGPLDPHRCVTRPVNAYALPPPGQPGTAFYLGASVDTQQRVQELDEANNGFVKGLMGVGRGPDLRISEVRAPASSLPGAGFLADVRVCNVGTESSPSSEAKLFTSTLDTLSLPTPGSPVATQEPVGSVPVPPLEAGSCFTVRTQGFAYVPPAASQPGQPLYVGAIIDPEQQLPELREDNNTRVAGRLGLGHDADLVITDVTGPSNFEPGMPVSASVTVCNVGTTEAWDVRADVLLSTEATLSASQGPGSQTESFVGQAQAPGLVAGRCVTLPVSGTSHPPPAFLPGAPLYLGARVDGMLSVQELREDNNTFTKGSVRMGPGPDLVVRSLKAPPNIPQSYSFPVEARVCNVGTRDLQGSAHLELFLSTVNTVALPTQLGSIPSEIQAPAGGADVSYLSAGQCQNVQVNAHRALPYEAQPGQPLYLGAAIDAFRNVQELNEDNNTFTQGLVGTGLEADLVITDVQAPANLRDGQSFTATYTVCNQGTASASSYGVSLFLSTETTPPVSRPPPAPPVFTELPRAYAFQGRAELSTLLGAGQCTTQRSTFNALRPLDAMPSPFERPLNLSAVVDLQGLEPRVDNNAFAAGIVGLGNGSDLTLTEVRGPASARPGDSFTTTVKVCNVGTAPTSGSSRVTVYVSADETLSAPGPQAPPPSWGSQALVGEAFPPPLNAGACHTQEIVGPAIPPPLAHPSRPLYLGAVVTPDGMAQELRWDNNTRMAGRLSVGNGADLVVTSLEAPGTVAPWEPFAASVRVCNVGTDPASSTEVALVVSSEETWTLPAPGSMTPFPGPSQFLAGFLNVAPLQAGQCVNAMGMVSVGMPPNTQPGQPVYLSAAVDPFQNRVELREDNNLFVRGRLGVGHEPDLVITGVTPPANILPGQPFTTTVTVCNQGAQATPNDVQVSLHLLTHPSLSLPAQGAPPPAPGELLGELSLPPLGAHACVTTPVTGSFHGNLEPQPRTYYVGASVDRRWNIWEVREDNNTFVGPRVGVGFAPDLVITAMGGPANAEPGANLQVPVTVCNQGTRPSPTGTVEFFLSTTSTLPEPTFPGGGIPPSSEVSMAGTVEIPSLPENACATREGTLYAYPLPTPYPNAPLFVGAMVRAWDANAELRTDNNAFMRGRMGMGFAPDLVVTELTAPFAVRGGEMFTTSLTVCNQGTTSTTGSGGRLELILSTQPTLAFTSPTPAPSPTQVTLGHLDLGELPAGQCTTRQLYTSAYPPPSAPGSGLFYLGALVDSRQTVMELREDNNAFVEGFLAVLQ
ncbi:CARDB domain-containing protein [Corallococcus exercitus]|uniref:CARDB domain-containing protein n=1 Tax=Corallococcus exercitus TaxID=2316736 RepID=UPI0035D4DCAF